MMIAGGARYPADQQPLPHGHSLEVHRVIVLNDRIDPVNVLQAKSGIIIGCLPEIRGRAGQQFEGKRRACSQCKRDPATSQAYAGKLWGFVRTWRDRPIRTQKHHLLKSVLVQQQFRARSQKNYAETVNSPGTDWNAASLVKPRQ